MPDMTQLPTYTKFFTPSSILIKFQIKRLQLIVYSKFFFKRKFQCYNLTSSEVP